MNRGGRQAEKFSLMDGKISAVMHYSSPDRFIICCHGLYSSKDSEKYVEMAEMAGEKNISVIRFDFRGCGESTGDIHDSTLSNRIADLEEVIRYVRTRFDSAKIALFGSSLGGMVAIAASSTDGEISTLSVLSTPCKIEDDPGMGEKFMKDLEKYDIPDAVRKVPPILIIHGRNDELVPVEHAKRLYDNASDDKKILFFDADHRFSAFRREALIASLGWIERHF